MTGGKGVPISEIRGSNETWGVPEYPAVGPSSSEHLVLYQTPDGFRPWEHLLKPVEGSDKWDDDYVRLPCSPSNQCQYINNEDKKQSRPLWKTIKEALQKNKDKKQSRPRWEMITEALQKVVDKQIQDSGQLVETILSYNPEYRQAWHFTGLATLLNDKLEEAENHAFFNSLLPAMAQLALDLPNLVQSPIPMLKKHSNMSVSLTQQQVSCLLANAFFCTYPLRNYYGVETAYDSYPFINFIRIFEVQNKCAWEKLKCICHYFKRVCRASSGPPRGVMTFTRRSVPPRDLPAWGQSSVHIGSVPLNVDTDGIIEQQDGLIQLDFANKYLGGGVLGSGCVQEEIRFSISPELLISMLFTEELEPNEALMMIGSELYSEYSGYGRSFTWKGDHEDVTPYDSCGRRRNAVLAIDACPFYDKQLEYSEEGIIRELNKAWVGFSFFTRENSKGLNYPGVATGNWGCGAFGGSPQLKALIQLMACAEAGRPMAYLTFGNAEFTDELYEMYECLVRKNVTVGQLYQHILNFAKEDEQLEELFAYLHGVINFKVKSSMI